MKKFNYFFYLCIALTLVISSCNNEGDEVISVEPEAAKVAIEPEFVENDGSEEEEALEEQAPTALDQTKTYGSYYNYTLLKPSGLTKSDVEGLKCGETKSLPLLVGSYKKKVGEIEVSNDDEYLYINVKANSYKYMKKVYFYIGNKADIPFYSNGYPNLKAFNYKAFPYYYGGQKRATYKIPLASIDSDCFEVVAYSKIYDAYSGCYYSSFGYDASLTQKYYYSYYSGCYYFGDWVRSFEFCKESCGPVCTPAIAYHDGCGFCSVDDAGDATYTNEFAYGSISTWGFAIIDLYTNVTGCDLSTGTKVGYLKVSVEDVATGLLKVQPYVDQNHFMCGVDFFYDHDQNAPLSDANYVNITYDEPTGMPNSFYITWPDTSKLIYFRGGATVVPGMNNAD